MKSPLKFSTALIAALSVSAASDEPLSETSEENLPKQSVSDIQEESLTRFRDLLEERRNLILAQQEEDQEKIEKCTTSIQQRVQAISLLIRQGNGDRYTSKEMKECEGLLKEITQKILGHKSLQLFSDDSGGVVDCSFEAKESICLVENFAKDAKNVKNNGVVQIAYLARRKEDGAVIGEVTVRYSQYQISVRATASPMFGSKFFASPSKVRTLRYNLNNTVGTMRSPAATLDWNQ